MKAMMQMMGLVVSALLMSNAFADAVAQKEAVRIDFNKMIDANASDKNELEKNVNAKIDHKNQAAVGVNADKNKVMDFVDVEVNMGKERPIVDRRFNSVGEARVATEFTVQLISKK